MWMAHRTLKFMIILTQNRAYSVFPFSVKDINSHSSMQARSHRIFLSISLTSHIQINTMFTYTYNQREHLAVYSLIFPKLKLWGIKNYERYTIWARLLASQFAIFVVKWTEMFCEKILTLLLLATVSANLPTELQSSIQAHSLIRLFSFHKRMLTLSLYQHLDHYSAGFYQTDWSKA